MNLLRCALFVAVSAPLARADLRSDFDCAHRQLALDFAQYLQPWRPAQAFADVRDALLGDAPGDCVLAAPLPAPPAALLRTRPPAAIAERGGLVVFVDGAKGSDAAGDGSVGNPVRSLARAVELTRNASSPGGFDTVVVRAGTLFATPTLVLTPADSGLAIQAYPGEEAWISGATPLTGITWAPVDVNVSVPWDVYPGATAVDFGAPGQPMLAYTNTSGECEALCIANFTGGGACTIWTWFDETNGGGWAKGCWARFDSVWRPRGGGGRVSGRRGQGKNVWSASLAGLGVAAVPGLRLGNSRLIRARFPNTVNPETDGFMPPAVIRADSWTSQQFPSAPDVQIDLDRSVVNRNSTVKMFQTFTAGIGGTCRHFQPDAGYWCSVNVQGGESGPYGVPMAAQFSTATLPNSPYRDASQLVVQTWRPGHWASWMYDGATVDPSSNASWTNFSFARGGFQGSRGEGQGEDTYVENVLEELDAPSEFFFNETTQTLFLFFNATPGVPPPADGSLVVPQTRHLFNITGTMAAPVTDVSIVGLGLRDTAYTYMDPHSIPSGGDWTLERSAVVFVEGAERVKIDGNVFERIDGNGVLFSGYVRNSTVAENEFAWIGATAVALWGNTHGGPPPADQLPPGYGVDGSQGDQPRHNSVSRNICRELGVWEKQSSCYTQFKSSENTLEGNIFYNGPRAQVNFNDGFRGGGRVLSNIIFNSCRESGDHGPVLYS